MVKCREPHAELLDPATREVWQTLEPISREDYEALPDEGLIRVGLGAGVMDEHWFDRSPGADRDGPMRVREIAGVRWGLCARPPLEGPTLPAGPDGPRQLMVDKHHVLLFRAGGRVQILRLPDGRDFVHVIEGGPSKPPLSPPDGWVVRELTLEEDWLVRLPHPTTAFFFANRDSYQGPVVTDGLV